MMEAAWRRPALANKSLTNMSKENSKVILDPTASGALLALAYNEGLLTESDDNDFCLNQLASQNYPVWVTTQALEQVFLFDQLHLRSAFLGRGFMVN